MNNIKHYGVKEIWNNDQPQMQSIEELYFQGFTVLENQIDIDKIKHYQECLEIVKQAEMQRMQEHDIHMPEDENNIRCPLAYHPDLLELSLHPTIHQILKNILGDHYVLLMQNAVINDSDKKQYQSKWHRDLNYQHWTSSKPMALNFLILLDDFTQYNGGTMVLPGSHLRQEFPSENYIKKHEVSVNAPKGSILLMDAMLYHRAGINVTNTTRRPVNHVVGRPFISQQIDIPRFIKTIRNVSYIEDEFLREFLGYRWNPPEDSINWRKTRSARTVEQSSC